MLFPGFLIGCIRASVLTYLVPLMCHVFQQPRTGLGTTLVHLYARHRELIRMPLYETHAIEGSYGTARGYM